MAFLWLIAVVLVSAFFTGEVHQVMGNILWMFNAACGTLLAMFAMCGDLVGRVIDKL